MTDQEIKDDLVRQSDQSICGYVYPFNYGSYHGIDPSRIRRLVEELHAEGLVTYDLYLSVLDITHKGRLYIAAQDYRPGIWVRIFRWIEAHW